MIRFVLNEMYEDIEIFLERMSSSDHIRSSVFYLLQFFIQVVEVLRVTVLYDIQKIQQFPFLYHFLKKLKMS